MSHIFLGIMFFFPLSRVTSLEAQILILGSSCYVRIGRDRKWRNQRIETKPHSLLFFLFALFDLARPFGRLGDMSLASTSLSRPNPFWLKDKLNESSQERASHSQWESRDAPQRTVRPSCVSPGQTWQGSKVNVEAN